ncbi:MAG TPA: aminotransferase class I/II-fold pyridoxal phosphate-dependent enzyme, partial [Saprospiraceae bacterium]|nr:aminotransferase class I/II-fold pyridoxal phosphate-dependent enzyme [Saprospiraceae bacterium]
SIEEGVEIFKNQPGSHVYTRYGNPTIEAVAQKIADLEVFGSTKTGYGLLTSSGMAAIHVACQSYLRPGDRILTQGNLYGGTTELFQKIFAPQQIQIEIADLDDLQKVEERLKTGTAQTIIYLETPSNPTLQCLDVQALSETAHAYGCKVIVDNTFATPVLQQPLLLGADLVIHSTTKYLHGHGVSTGGAIVCTEAETHFKLWETMKLVGSNSNAFDAWLINLGMKTLALRMERQSQNAFALARFLSTHPKIGKVHYPGLPQHPEHPIALKQMKAFGAMLSFEIGNSAEDAIHFANRVQLFAMAPSLGETDSMIIHPATMSHSKMDPHLRKKYHITDHLIRMSVGLENIEDLLLDIRTALES